MHINYFVMFNFMKFKKKKKKKEEERVVEYIG